ITGAGSTWSQVAIDAWRADVRANGLVVNYSGTGSSDGRAQYIQHTVDFAVSEFPFQNPPEPGQPAEVPDLPYAYIPTADGVTSFYPSYGSSKAQVGSNGVDNYVAASYGEGAIGYVEYAYAKRVNFPVASLLNKAGYFTQPSAGDVAVALTKAQINKDLTQNL